MPENTPDNRRKYPKAAGHGSADLLFREELAIRRGVGPGMRAKILRRFSEHPETLFVYRPKARSCAMHWQPLCAREDCTETIDPKSFKQYSHRLCSKHAQTVYKGHVIKSAAILQLYRDGRIVDCLTTKNNKPRWIAKCSVAACSGVYEASSYFGRRHNMCPLCSVSYFSPALPYERAKQDQSDADMPLWAMTVCHVKDSQGLWKPHRRCRSGDCDGLVPASKKWWLAKHRADNCNKCKLPYVAAGIRHRSKLLEKNKHLIVEWRKNGYGKIVPFCACMGHGCSERVEWKYGWSEKAKASILCPRCGFTGSVFLMPHEAAYNQLLITAKRRQIPVELTYPDFVTLCRIENCFYCATPLNRVARKVLASKGNHLAHYLDRKKSELGYTLDNVVPCCGPCNITKCKWLSFEEMQVVGAIRQGRLQQAKRLVGDLRQTLRQHSEHIKAIWNARGRHP